MPGFRGTRSFGTEEFDPKEIEVDPVRMKAYGLSVGQIAAAVREPVTYVAVGPVFGTRTKDTPASTTAPPAIHQVKLPPW